MSRDYNAYGCDASWFSTHSGLQNNFRDNPTFATKLSGFTTNMATMGSVVKVAFVKFCFIDGPTDPDAAYDATMSALATLRSTYPDVIFVLWTMPIEAAANTDHQPANRQHYNVMARQGAIDLGIPLFDIADLESDGGTILSSGRECLSDSYTTDGGHLNATGKTKVAGAWWRMAALLASDPVWTVSFDSQGGSAVSSQNIEDGGLVTEPSDPTRTGYTFNGWFTASSGGTEWNFATGTITSNTTLYAHWTINSFTVSFDSQGGSSVSSQSVNYGSTATEPSDPTRSGYAFKGWYTQASGGSLFDFDTQITSATTLYAHWAATYRVSYSGNGATGGTAPVDSTVYESGATVTVLGNTGSLIRSGYTFANWNTAANGSGTSYNPAATFSITGNVTLYAQWNASHTVTYNPNGATEGSVPVDSTSYAQGATVTVRGNTGGLGRYRYTFVDWCTTADGSGTHYDANDTFSMGSANINLYAIWTPTVYQPGDTINMPGTGLRLYAAWTHV
jgi:uncharacterized repeat protein (TIGR02543 family)